MKITRDGFTEDLDNTLAQIPAHAQPFFLRELGDLLEKTRTSYTSPLAHNREKKGEAITHLVRFFQELEPGIRVSADTIATATKIPHHTVHTWTKQVNQTYHLSLIAISPKGARGGIFYAKAPSKCTLTIPSKVPSVKDIVELGELVFHTYAKERPNRKIDYEKVFENVQNPAEKVIRRYAQVLWEELREKTKALPESSSIEVSGAYTGQYQKLSVAKQGIRVGEGRWHLFDSVTEDVNDDYLLKVRFHDGKLRTLLNDKVPVPHMQYNKNLIVYNPRLCQLETE
jgi:hypothetical protein